jgi:hypothetical protein
VSNPDELLNRIRILELTVRSLTARLEQLERRGTNEQGKVLEVGETTKDL